jgi:hypothetical protein
MMALSDANLATTITRPHATSLLSVGDFIKKECAAIIQKAWRNLNITEKKLLEGTDQQNLQEVARHSERNECLC